MKIKIYIALSVDGFIAKSDGDIEWLNNPDYILDRINGVNYDDFISTIDTIVMGRNSYEKVLTFDFWPYDNIDVVVLTSKDMIIPQKLIGKIRVKSGSVHKILNELESEGKQSIYVDGGYTIQNFLKANKVDEITLTTIPIILGGGVSLFDSIGKSIILKLVESNSSTNGFVQNRYIVVK